MSLILTFVSLWDFCVGVSMVISYRELSLHAYIYIYANICSCNVREGDEPSEMDIDTHVSQGLRVCVTVHRCGRAKHHSVKQVYNKKPVKILICPQANLKNSQYQLCIILYPPITATHLVQLSQSQLQTLSYTALHQLFHCGQHNFRYILQTYLRRV